MVDLDKALQERKASPSPALTSVLVKKKYCPCQSGGFSHQSATKWPAGLFTAVPASVSAVDRLDCERLGSE